jgi:uncharacterized protein (DUF58 family)
VPRVRPTIAGNWFGVLLAGVLFAAVNTANNLVYVVLGTLLTVLLVNNLLSEWNLRGLTVARRLPSEAFAGEPARGAWVVHNARARGTAWLVDLAEVGDAVRGAGHAAAVPPGGSAEVIGTWQFERRGTCVLAAVRVGSRYPFGLIERYRDFPLPSEILVYPAPAPGAPEDRRPAEGETAEGSAVRGATGELVGLRAWRPGDAVRRVHWPLSARLGTPVVIERTGMEGAEAVIRVDARDGEFGISQACGAVIAHARRGDAIGLSVGTTGLPPRRGEAARREALTTLARLPPA